VIRGQALQITSVTQSPTLVLPFKTEFGEFYLEITEQQNKAAQTPATKV